MTEPAQHQTRPGAQASSSPINPHKITAEMFVGVPQFEAMSQADKVSLVQYLDMVNGQDAYSGTTAALGKLAPGEYLALPNNYEWVTRPAADVGSKDAHVPNAVLAQVYALNMARAPPNEDPQMFAMLRTLAVQIGWLDLANQKEVVLVQPVNHASATTAFAMGMVALKDRLEVAKSAALLVPLAVEHTFRTMGHHYVGGQASTYVDRYNRTLRACVMGECANLLGPSALFHTTFHWIGPAREWSVLKALVETERIPDAMKLRATAAPAGTALVTTAVAVLDALEAAGLKEQLRAACKLDIDLLDKMAKEVREHPPSYHKSYFAYGVAQADVPSLIRLGAAKDVAKSLAPVLQGFLDSVMQNAPLGRAKALNKAAEENPVMRRRAATMFRNVARMRADGFAELYSLTIGKGLGPADEVVADVAD